MEKIYPYAVSKIKAKEVNMLTNQNFEALASEKGLDRIVSVMIEKGYDFEEITRKEEFEKVLKKEEEKLYSLVRELIENEDVSKIFLSKNNYHNVKLILKSQIQKKDYRENLNYGGTIDVKNLITIMENEKYENLEENMSNSIIYAKNQYEKLKNPFVIDCILDKASFVEMKNLALKTENEFLIKYVEKLIDITNIKTFFRIRKMYKDAKILSIAFIDGGSLSYNNFKNNLNEDAQNLKNKFAGFSDVIEKAVYNYENLDIYCDNYIMEYMKEANLKALTIEPIIAYIYAKETEIKNIRIIFTGKLNNINSEKIKERLREAYV